MKYELGIVDYLVLILVFGISILIGFYHGLKQRVKNYFSKDKVILKESVADYFTASSSMKSVPVAFSLLASFFSTTGILGVPAEVYQYGLQYWVTAFSGIFAPVIGAFTTGPFFAHLRIFTVFQYLQLRFGSKYVKYIGTVCYLIKTSISSSIFIFGPAVSLSLFTSFSNNYSIALVGVIATLYTAIGGIKGVIWTDFFQVIVMVGFLVSVFIKGIYDIGGFGNFFQINSSGGRFNVFDFDPDPFKRQTFWSLFFGFLLSFSYSYSTDQQSLQRFQATRTKKLAQRALLLNVPGVFIMLSLCCFAGLILYANFAGCDPLASQQIDNPNQLVGYFVITSFRNVQGAAGFFLSCVFSSSLSSASSCLNSISSVLWEDYFKPFSYFKNLSESKKLTTTKMLVVASGTVSTLFAFMISSFGSNLSQVSGSLNGALNSPILGLFVLGCMFKTSNSVGAACGCMIGFIFGLWISFGAYITKPYYPKLNVTTEFCDFDFLSRNQSVITSDLSGFNKFYSISYMWYTPMGTLVTVLSGLIISIATGGLKQNVDDSFILYKYFIKKKVGDEVELPSLANN
ncbi:sodium-coupled monocarboxylate transporter 1-like [Brachionus plicatilis]|uniref:Sodium-coupled monocarboxylate transporter 1-like n=1 Tax=Brachionus plicatilis TaxID=10195 RepID=A0A3M7PG23_BRAPC|nr:sodium-coupled monocarboxylate transporter 1-like [Brachionus plicatilis]